MRHPRAWKIGPYLLLIAGVFGFLRLADHYEWTGGVTALMGGLMLMLFILIVGPLTLLPELQRARDEGRTSGWDLLDALSESARKESRTSEGVSFRLKD